jgi:hypothetical protein
MGQDDLHEAGDDVDEERDVCERRRDAKHPTRHLVATHRPVRARRFHDLVAGMNVWNENFYKSEN